MDQPKTSRLRTAALGLLLAVATWLAIEGISFAAFSVWNRTLFSYGKVVAEMTAGDTSGTAEAALSGRTYLNWNDYVEVLHPYFGFVADPKKNRPFWAVSDFGFIFNGKTNEITKRAPGRLVVAVFGGSFANGVYPPLNALFHAKASELGKEVQVVNFSSAGYKQPQQLMVLNYLMALGAQFDIVVNVDGFNDITLPVVENLPHHVNPFYPRSWERRTADTISPADLRQIGSIEFLKDRRAGWSRFFAKKHLYLSPTLCLIWQFGDQAMSRAVYSAQQGVLAEASDSKSYTMHGPTYSYSGEPQLYRDLAGVWKNASEQMNVLCAAQGTRYYHFLQPNQYVPHSKPMAPEEEKRARPQRNLFQSTVVKGYPYLFEAGEELKRDGVDFSDLTRIFAHDRTPRYVDDCCHLTAAGYDIVARGIYAHIYPSQKRE